MANESRVFRLPAGMSTQVVANAVEAFLSSAKCPLPAKIDRKKVKKTE